MKVKVCEKCRKFFYEYVEKCLHCGGELKTEEKKGGGMNE